MRELFCKLLCDASTELQTLCGTYLTICHFYDVAIKDLPLLVLMSYVSMTCESSEKFLIVTCKSGKKLNISQR